MYSEQQGKEDENDTGESSVGLNKIVVRKYEEHYSQYVHVNTISCAVMKYEYVPAVRMISRRIFVLAGLLYEFSMSVFNQDV